MVDSFLVALGEKGIRRPSKSTDAGSPGSQGKKKK
jgi:hypothetical protein